MSINVKTVNGRTISTSSQPQKSIVKKRILSKTENPFFGEFVDPKQVRPLEQMVATDALVSDSWHFYFANHNPDESAPADAPTIKNNVWYHLLPRSEPEYYIQYRGGMSLLLDPRTNVVRFLCRQSDSDLLVQNYEFLNKAQVATIVGRMPHLNSVMVTYQTPELNQNQLANVFGPVGPRIGSAEPVFPK